MYCTHCGQEIDNDALVCPHCGKSVAEEETKVAEAEAKVEEAHQEPVKEEADETIVETPAATHTEAPVHSEPQAKAGLKEVGDGIVVTAKVFYIISMIALAICTFGIALAWCLPMKRRLFPAIENREEISMALKVCTLIFVNTVSGILLLAGYHD